MKRLLAASAALAFAGAALATDFTTITFQTDDGSATPPSLGQSFSILNNSYTASFTTFQLTGHPYIDVAWTHRFDTTVSVANSPATAPYTTVTQTVVGRVRRAAGTGTGVVNVSTILSETITDLVGAYVNSASATRNFTGTTDANTYIPFTLTLTTPFNRALPAGFAIKDDLFINSDPSSTVVIDSIAQNYTPVPEPASLAALAFGGLGLLARRRRK